MQSIRHFNIRRLVAPVMLGLIVWFLYREQIFYTLIDEKGFFGAKRDFAIRYLYLLDEFSKQFRAGTWYPRWIYSLYGGYGYPTFLLYPPGYWFATLPFTYLTGAMDKAAVLSNVFYTLMAFTAYYKIARFLNNGVYMSLALVVLVSFDRMWANGGAYTNIGLSSRYAYCFALWGIYLLLQFCRERSAGRNATLYGLGWLASGVAVFYSHPFEAGLYVFLNLVIFIGVCIELPDFRSRLRLFMALATGGALVLALSSPYWLTVAYFKELVNFQAAFPVYNTPQGVLRSYNPLGFLYHHFYDPRIEIALYALLLYCMWRIRSEVWMWPLLAAYPLLVFLMLPESYPVWGLPGLRSIMTPGRMESLLITVEFMIVSAAAAREPRLQEWKYALSLYVVLLTPQALLHSTLMHVWQRPDKVVYESARRNLQKSQFLSFQGWDEFRPNTANIQGLPNLYATRGRVYMLGEKTPDDLRKKVTLKPIITDGKPQAEIKLPDGLERPQVVTVNQLYLPGWVVMLDGRELSFTQHHHWSEDDQYFSFDDHGRIEAHVIDPGKHTLEARYDGPPGWLVRNMVIVMLLTGLLPLFIRLSRPRRHDGVA